MDLLVHPLTIASGNITQRCLAGAVTGVLSHLLYFIRGYHVTSAYGILLTHIALYTAITALSVVQTGGILTGLAASTIVGASYLAALFTSIIVYRLFFHPLRKFPGPLFGRITKMYGPWTNRHGQMHIEQNKLFAKYGDIVRIAPNELLILSTDAIPKIHAAKSGCRKRHAGVYDVVHYRGAYNLDSILDREEHRWRRQVWERAMTTSSLSSYEPLTREVCHAWLSKLQTASASRDELDTSLFSLLITFDNMGKIGFGHEFGTVAAGRENRMLRLLEVMFGQVAGLGELAWPIAVMQGFGVGGDAAEFDELARGMAEMVMREDQKNPEQKNIIVGHFIQDFQSEKPTAFFEENILYSDAGLVLVGATDTIAAALSYAFYHLAVHGGVQEKLAGLVGEVFGVTVPGEFANADLAKIEFLDAVINETLRLDNPVCNNAARLTPPEGIVVDGLYIPGGVSVRVPGYAMQRSEKGFVRPDEFIPERWTEWPELIVDRAAFMPFIVGPNNCVGKRLAMMVLRLVLAYTVHHYRFELAPGEDGTAIYREAKNNLILKAGPLKLVFDRRE
ncbi:Tryprostatin B 6-hydroxylase [Echria macrotheca]|uniref:Tryprostatin B 6-hydroxylase n=1 Tax=Echria macrotheca TaxID=438768 RepID=A0AAJ0BFZ3_9PEZI|nr:Tryprostatin B 6-hydroxylase [Echria macrotheca]